MWFGFVTTLAFLIFFVFAVLKRDCDEVRVVLVGDVLVGSGRLLDQIANNNYTLTELGPFERYFNKADLVIGNYEGVIANSGVPRNKGLPSSFSVKTNEKILDALQFGVPTVLTLANNHIADYGHEGVRSTLAAVQKRHNLFPVGIVGGGELLGGGQVVEIKGMSIGVLAFTDLLPPEYLAGKDVSVARLTSHNIQTGISELREAGADFVIVSLHTVADMAASSQFEPDEHQKEFYRKAAEYGADVVIGQQPHLLQKLELHKNTLIVYSLGVFYYNPSVSSTYAPESPLFEGTQFNGGGVLNLGVCSNGEYNFDIVPTRMVITNEKIILVDNFNIKDFLIESKAKMHHMLAVYLTR